MALPTRTSNDPNAAADINSLQTQITSMSAAIYSTLANYGQNVTVDGVAKTLYFKTITGTTDAGDDTTTVAHGLTLSKILFVNLIVQNSGTDWYNFSDATQTYVQFDATNMYVVAVPAGFRNEAYKLTIAHHS